MRKAKQFLLCLVLGFGLTQTASPFSMLGEFAPWMVQRIAYNGVFDDIGGPVNLGEEYRVNIPVIYYGFDESFINYFGQRGIQEIEKGVLLFNRLPRASRMSVSLEEFPLDTLRVNFEAQAQGLVDLKSMAMAMMTEVLGMTSAERFVWTLQARYPLPPPAVNYVVVMRSFDPVTLQPSAYINGVLYSYRIREFVAPVEYADAVETLVDPFQRSFTVASGANGSPGLVRLGDGEFFTGLTRDDVGGLRYLYSPRNRQVEGLIPGATGGGSPYSPSAPGIIITNVNGGGAVGGGGASVTAAGDPYAPSAPGGVVNPALLVDAGIRGGLDKIRFQRVHYDSRIGGFIPFTNSWTDAFITNRQVRVQRVQRALTIPDIVFAAEDLGTTPNGVATIINRIGRGTPAAPGAFGINNNAINGSADLVGPGIMLPQFNLTFSKMGVAFLNQGPNFLNESDALFRFFRWGSFDGSTNAPFIYPVNEIVF